MVSDTVYELCLPVLQDEALDEEEKTDKLQELLTKETSLGGPGLVNTVLDILWKHRERSESKAEQTGSSTPKTRFRQIRRQSPAPWRPSTPTGTSPVQQSRLAAMKPGMLRAQSYNHVAMSAPSPFGSPRLTSGKFTPMGTPGLPLSPSLARYEPSGDYFGSMRPDSGFQTPSNNDDWFIPGLDGASDDPSMDEIANGSSNTANGALPYDMLRSVAGEHLTDEELEAALEASGYDLGSALSMLTGQPSTPLVDSTPSMDFAVPHVVIGKSMRAKAPASPRSGTPSGRSRQGIICKYYLNNGSCLRDDCRFSHDPSKHICKYWINGMCTAGERCIFSHDPTLAMEQLSLGQLPTPTTGSKLNPNVQDYSFFPSLPIPAITGSESPTTGSSLPRHAAEASEFVPSAFSTPSSPGTAPRTRLSGNASSFQPRSRPTSRQTSMSFGESGDVDEFPSLAAAAAARRIRNARRKSQDQSMRPRNLADIVRHSVADDDNPSPSQTFRPEIQAGHSVGNAKHIPPPSHIPWLETGAEANRAYLAARGQAMKHASLRNRFLQSAAQAWNRNDARAAKTLSMRGQAENETMRKLHREAAEELYRSRNSHRGGAGGGSSSAALHRRDDGSETGEIFVDLHGLHTDEAIDYVEKCLLENQQSGRPLYVITGTGHHSRSGREKIGRSVRGWLEGWGYAFREFSVPGDRNAAGGILGVDPGSFDRRLLQESSSKRTEEPAGYLGEGKIKIIKERPGAAKR